MKSCHYSHLSGSKVDVDVTVTIASCVRASQQTFASLFFLFSSLLTLVHTPMRSHRFSHSQLAESSQHSWAPSMTSSLSLSFDLTPHLSQLSWAIFITKKKKTKISIVAGCLSGVTKRLIKTLQETNMWAASVWIVAYVLCSSSSSSSVTPPDEEAYFLCAASAQVYSDD